MAFLVSMTRKNWKKFDWTRFDINQHQCQLISIVYNTDLKIKNIKEKILLLSIINMLNMSKIFKECDNIERTSS